MATVEFWLSRPNPEDGSLRKYDPMTGREGSVVRFPNYTGIKAEDIVYDPREYIVRKGEEIPNPNYGKQTKIRLALGEPSIFVDEQSDEKPKLVKLAFTSGYLIFDEHAEPQKAEYLRLTNTNQNPSYNGKPVKRYPNRQYVFFELNKGQIASEEVDRDMQLAEALVKIKNFDADDLKKYARVFGIDTDEVNRDISEVRRDLIIEAKMDIDNFFDIIYDEVYVDTQSAIFDGVEEAVLISNNDGSFSWRNGGVVFKPTRGEDPIEGFTDFLIHTEDGKQVYKKLTSALSRAAKKPEQVEADEKLKTKEQKEQQIRLKTMDIIESKLLEFRFGKGFFYNNEFLGKSKAKVADAIVANKELFNELLELYEKEA